MNDVSPDVEGWDPLLRDQPRLAAQLRFLAEIDALKSVIRQTTLMDASRRENDAEHSWHLAMMALLLAEHAPGTDPARVAKMLLIHDIVEIDAGDVFFFDAAGMVGQAEREARAAERIFGLLPPDQGHDLKALWEEFEERISPDARFARAIDRLQPLMQNFRSGGGTWRRPEVTPGRETDRIVRLIEDGSPVLAAFARELLAEGARRGYFDAISAASVD
jgi:putative hydrolase of HD superfamily